MSGAKQIRVGDEWVFDSNDGGIARIVTGVDAERIYYRPFGSPHEQSCLLKTFRRWLKGARLVYAADWEGRGDHG